MGAPRRTRTDADATNAGLRITRTSAIGIHGAGGIWQKSEDVKRGGVTDMKIYRAVIEIKDADDLQRQTMRDVLHNVLDEYMDATVIELTEVTPDARVAPTA
jgi:hypothetical protein